MGAQCAYSWAPWGEMGYLPLYAWEEDQAATPLCALPSQSGMYLPPALLGDKGDSSELHFQCAFSCFRTWGPSWFPHPQPWVWSYLS